MNFYPTMDFELVRFEMQTFTNSFQRVTNLLVRDTNTRAAIHSRIGLMYSAFEDNMTAYRQALRS